MDTKRFRDFEIKSESQGTVSAAFCSFDVRDLDGDVVRRGAFTDGASVVISAFGHKSWDGQLPIGKGKIRVGSNEAIMDGRLFLNTTHGRDAFETIRHLSEAGLQEWSFSLENTKSTRGTLAGEPVRFIDEVTVTEVSPVLKGAGIGTRTLSIKHRGADQLPAELVSSCLQHLAEHKAAERAELDRIYANVVFGSAQQTLASLVDHQRRQRVYVETQPMNATVAAEAKEVCQVASAELGIEPPPLYWYRPATAQEKDFHDRFAYLPGELFTDERNLSGLCRPGDRPVIAVRANLARDYLLSVVAHEVRHAAGGDEDEARLYERDWLERITAVPTLIGATP